MQYQVENGSTLTVRYGPVTVRWEVTQLIRRAPLAVRQSRGQDRFLLDSDSFWQAEDTVPEFSADWIYERCHLLHEPVSELFRIAVTDKLRREVFK